MSSSQYTSFYQMILSLVNFVCFFLLSNAWIVTGKQVIISNVLPRLDINGNIVNAHDGCLVKFNKTYFMYGTVYDECHQSTTICDGICGYINNTFALYTSSDLVSWTLISNNIVPEITKDNSYINYWMPNVGYNLRTKQYVMIYWSSRYGYKNSFVALAVSSTPYGPFINVRPLEMQGGKIISDTTNLFVDDDDNTAYVRYNTRDQPLRHIVEKLSSDWMSTTGQYSIIFQKDDFPWYNGGGMFKRKEFYYTMLSFDCCFCQWGSDARIYRSNKILGNWTYLGQLNYCADGGAPPEHLKDITINPCSIDDPYGTNFTVPAHQVNVATLSISSTETVHLYYGERFRSSQDGLKAHDFQTWLPIQFIDLCIQPLRFFNNFTLNIDVEFET
ncbi:hypothetical protein I4U23_003410 [Adineta vaga]|nr:hypothetical protein I4U23_003410 [Adineta vaga]